MSDFPAMDRRIAIFEGLRRMQALELSLLRKRYRREKELKNPNRRRIDELASSIWKAKDALKKTERSLQKDRDSISTRQPER